MNKEQVEILLNAAQKSPIRMQVMIALFTGLRRSEINGLKYSDINFENRTMTIKRQLGRTPNTNINDFKLGEYTKQEIPLKTKSSYRTINIPDRLFEAILEQQRIYDKNKRRRINDKTNPFKDYDFICCSTYGNPHSPGYHRKYFKDLLKNNNLPDIRFHDLRSTYTTMLINEKFNPKAISKNLGHAKEIITLDIYTDPKNIINDVTKPIDNFIKTLNKNSDNDLDKILIKTQNLITELL